MTTTKTMEKTARTHWAAEAGAKVAARRAERLAERRAEAEADGARQQLPAAELARRFIAVAALVVEAIDAFATAAEIPIDSDPVAAGSLQLKTTTDRLWLQRTDDVLAAEFRGRSRAETVSFDLGAETFAPEDTARHIAETWIRQLEASEGLHHVDAR